MIGFRIAGGGAQEKFGITPGLNETSGQRLLAVVMELGGGFAILGMANQRDVEAAQ